MYYTKDGKPSLTPQTDEDRFGIWLKKVSDCRLVKVHERVKDKFGKPARDVYGRPIYKEIEKVIGTGIAEPTASELAQVYAKPCRYWRAARASRA